MKFVTKRWAQNLSKAIYIYMALDRFAAYMLAKSSKSPRFYSQKWPREKGLKKMPKRH